MVSKGELISYFFIRRLPLLGSFYHVSRGEGTKGG
jgi:hypothetical protein